ncbi:MAG: DUF5615 family PIN-like protein [Dehalococcoidia bacterium]|nr:DUF5615 family PIN-like protein [Dehalococcoidia bacterium]
MRYYLDEDMSGKIAGIARGMGVDIVTASERGNAGADDDFQLAYAATEVRCLVTRNRGHFISLTVKFFEEERPHAGVLVIPYSLPNDRFNLIARAIARYDIDHPDGIPAYGLDFVSHLPQVES